MNHQQQIVIQCVQAKLNNADDDLCRAKLAFRGKDPEGEHGQSGRTRARMLVEYHQQVQKYKGALEWAKFAKLGEFG